MPMRHAPLSMSSLHWRQRARAVGAGSAPLMRDTEPRSFGEIVHAGDGVGCDALEKCFRSLVGSALQVEPQRHLALAECVRLALAEAELVFGDLLVAAAAFRAAAGCGFDDVRHGADYRPDRRPYLTPPGAGRLTVKVG